MESHALSNATVSNNQLVVDALTRFPQRTAFITGDRSYTYRQTADLIGRMVTVLHAMGVKHGSGVGLLAGNSPEVWMAQTAVQLLGGHTIGLHAKAAVEDHTHICADSLMSAMIADLTFADAAARALESSGIGAPLLTLGPSDAPLDLLALALEAHAAPLDPGDATSDDLLEILYTGGTTGNPKGVLQTHTARAAISLLSPLAYEMPLTPVYLASTPITHAAAHFLLPTLLRGGTVVLTDGFDPDEFLHNVRTHHVNVTFAVPSMIYKLLGHGTAGELAMPTMERIIYGASPMSVPRLIEAHDVFGPVFTQIYGQTESLALCTALLAGEHDLTDPDRLASCGRVVPGMRLELLDDDGHPVAPGTAGEICVRGPGVMRGYLNQPELTAETLAGGWLHTGDVGRADDDGYITIVDRKKDFIISGGFNVYSREVENALTQDPTVAAAVVFGVPDPIWGEAVTAIVVPRPGHVLDVEALKARVRASKGPVATPKAIEIADAIPLTPLGKPDKKAVRARFWSDLDRAVN